MALNLQSLSKSIGALRTSIETCEKNWNSISEDMQNTLRAGVIQNFEVAYEQSWKMLQRWIKTNLSPEEAEHPRTRKELFRVAARKGLIQDPTAWFEYAEARNMTSHTYDEENALSVFETAKKFVPDAAFLLLKLEELND
ncbi:MAG: nucleotidyltransferase substrate binding protein [Spirochaetia bacterium]